VTGWLFCHPVFLCSPLKRYSGLRLAEILNLFFDAAGIKKPDISILDDKFLAEIKGLPQKNLALELLKRLLEDDIKTKGQSNASQSKKFSILLSEAVKRYQSGLIEAAEVIEELIRLAQKLLKTGTSRISRRTKCIRCTDPISQCKSCRPIRPQHRHLY